GLIAFGLAVPPIGTIAAVMHMAGHTLVKSSLFFGAGEILLRHKTTHAERIRGILSYAPYTGVLFLLGILAIIAMPPSVLFVSEFSLIAVLIQSHVWLAIILLAALGLIAFSMLRLTVGMLFADRAETAKIDQPKERWNLTHTVMSTQLLLVAIMAVWFSTGAGQRFVSAIASNLF
ncbi:hypothetical protein HGA64_01830, partial [Candidatus Falkowbacteria bacterium]|nr:hypothetical protein [Candidatus Falkowbacteria bacterium]